MTPSKKGAAMNSPSRIDNMRVIRAPHGPELSAKSWLTEAPLRMLMNNLDPDVAERPGELVVYGGIGRAARDWQCLRPHRRDAAPARGRRDAAGAVGQAGRRVPHPRRRAARADRQFQPGAALGDLGAFPRARSQGPDDVRPDDRGLVDLHRQPGHRAGHLRDLRRDGPPALRRRSRGQLDSDRRPRRHGRRAAAGGDHGRRVAAGGRMPARRRIELRLRTGYLDVAAKDLDEALAIIERATKERQSRSRSALLGNAAEVLPELLRRGVRPDVVTDQTSAHDPVNGYLPEGLDAAAMGGAARERSQGRRARRASVDGRARARDAATSTAPACRPSTTATTSARWRWRRASSDAFDFPGFVPAYIRPLFCRGIGPFRWAALSGDPGGHLPHRRQGEGADARRRASAQLARHGARSASSSRACRRASAGWASATATGSASPSTRWWRAGELKAPIVIGRDHLDSGSVASPNRETEAMQDGSDAVSDWPLLNALLNCASRRDLGVAAPRRRRRHGLFAARRHGDRLRRHAGGRAAASSACCGTIRRPA